MTSSCEEEDQITADTLDWSVSCISARDEFRRQISSEAMSLASPEAESDLDPGRQRGAGRESDFAVQERLLETMRSLCGNSKSRHQMIENESDLSFQTLPVEETTNDDDHDHEERGGQTLDVNPRTQTINSTPPVRDPGLHATADDCEGDRRGSSSKVEQMRRVLRDLEGAIQQQQQQQPSPTSSRNSSSASKIPRRSLSYKSSSASSRPGSGMTGNSNRENSDGTVIEVKQAAAASNDEEREELKEKLRREMSRSEELSSLNRELKRNIDEQEEKLFAAQNELARKSLALKETTLRLNKAVRCWEEDAEEKRLAAMKAAQEAAAATNREKSEAKKQLAICEAELEKAVKLASDFKLKFEAEEKQAEKCRRFEERNVELEEKIDSLEGQVRDARNMQKVKDGERGRLQSQLNQMEKKLTSISRQLSAEIEKNNSTEVKLRSAYQKQMDQILSEKARQVHQDVLQMEEAFIRERGEAVQQAVAACELKNDKIRLDLINEARERERNFEATLEAARKEADCLREQLGYAQKRQSTSSTTSSLSNFWKSDVNAVSTSIDRLNNAASLVLGGGDKKTNNNAAVNRLFSGSSSRSGNPSSAEEKKQLRSIPVIRKSTNSNNIKRPKSAPPRRNNFAFDLNESKLTLEEKKVLTNDVLSEFLSQNPHLNPNEIEDALKPLVAEILQQRSFNDGGNHHHQHQRVLNVTKGKKIVK